VPILQSPPTFKSLADGQLPNAKGTLYTAVVETKINQLLLVTTDLLAHTVNIYFKRSGGTSRRIIPKDLPMDGSDPTKAAMVSAIEYTLEMLPGDEIEGDADTAAVIDYVMSGEARG
jgi:hypothetical protein